MNFERKSLGREQVHETREKYLGQFLFIEAFELSRLRADSFLVIPLRRSCHLSYGVKKS